MSPLDPRIAALVAHVRSLLPSLEDVVSYTPSSSDDLGPNVTIPAVYLHILMSHCDHLRLEARVAEMAPKVQAYEAWTNVMLTGQMAGVA